uniref:Uncharacterized protein n=1 Tax=Octopus bimaculoides TaxID=37653 RepID=A0A0L8GNF0_OCTBM
MNLAVVVPCVSVRNAIGSRGIGNKPLAAISVRFGRVSIKGYRANKWLSSIAYSGCCNGISCFVCKLVSTWSYNNTH